MNLCFRLLRMLFVSAMVVALSPAVLPAQTLDKDSLANVLQEKALDEFYAYAIDYWTPKLVGYKQYIDRSISESDLTELTNLRMRWTLHMEERKLHWEKKRKIYRMIDSMMRSTESYSMSSEGDVDADSALMDALHSPDMEIKSPLRGGVHIQWERYGIYNNEAESLESMLWGAESSEDSAMIIVNHAINSVNRSVNQEMDAADEALVEDSSAIGDETDEVSSDSLSEVQSIIDVEHQDYDEGYPDDDYECEGIYCGDGNNILFSLGGLMDRSRPVYNVLDKRVVADLVNFFEGLLVVRDRFMSAHSAEINATSSVDKWVNEFKVINNHAKRRNQAENVLEDNLISLRDFITLFNGGDIFLLLGEFNRSAETGSSISSTPQESGAIVGKRTRLMQNSPNPASSNTVIAFQLAEPSNATRLCLYGATGEVVSEMDLGSIAAGEHKISLNVSDFAVGNYVYHLTAQSSIGEEVFSKVMRVVR